jgi:hypothetical protein
MKYLHCKSWATLFSIGILLLAAQTQAALASPAPAVHGVIQDYDGPGTCAMCHPNAAQEVVESLHYQMLGEAPFRVGWEAGMLGGMNATY